MNQVTVRPRAPDSAAWELAPHFRALQGRGRGGGRCRLGEGGGTGVQEAVTWAQLGLLGALPTSRKVTSGDREPLSRPHVRVERSECGRHALREGLSPRVSHSPADRRPPQARSFPAGSSSRCPNGLGEARVGVTAAGSGRPRGVAGLHAQPPGPAHK